MATFIFEQKDRVYPRIMADDFDRENSTPVYDIPVHLMSKVTSKLNRANKRAEKLGLEKLVMHTISEYTMLVPELNKGTMLSNEYVMLAITGPKIMLDGWTFVSKLDFALGSKPIIRTEPSMTLPVEFRDVKPCRCDHCNKAAARIKSYVLHSETEGYKVVGSSCVKDFLKGYSPADIAYVFDFTLDEFSESDYDGCGSGKTFVSLPDFLPYVAASIRTFGWTSKGAAKFSDEIISTADDAWIHMNPPVAGKFTPSYTVADVDKETAVKAVEWAAGLNDVETEDNEYLHNLNLFADAGYCEVWAIGYVASIVSSFLKMETKRQEKTDKTPSEFVGTVKKRDLFELTVKKHISWDGYYGTTHFYIFEDSNDNVFVWKASGTAGLDTDEGWVSVQEGKTYKIRGTVKAHEVYIKTDTKQTIITRCKVESMVEENEG